MQHPSPRYHAPRSPNAIKLSCYGIVGVRYAHSNLRELTLPKPASVSPLPVTMTYSAANRLATYNGQAVQFDADGNLLTAPLQGQMSSLQFDSRNRLVQAGNTTYRYDAENQRIGVNQTQLVVNSQPLLSQVLVKEENGVKTFYIYGFGLLGDETDGEYRSYHFDFRGSTVALTDNAGKVVQRFQYGPYGELLKGEASVTPFLFNGKFGVMTEGNGLYYMRARFYSPGIKRFVNQDILRGFITHGPSLNRYTYVANRPISDIDPFGLDEEPVGFWEGITPIWGPLNYARYYNEQGKYGLGAFYTVVAISDLFLAKAIATALAKGIRKNVAKAGAGGNWPVINEVVDSKVVKQIDSLSCGAACGEMVLKDLGIDVLLEQLPKGLTDVNSLARALNKVSPGVKWYGNFVDPSSFATLTKGGSWIAMMWEKGNRAGHWVVVDGVDNLGQVLIRDSWNGTKYSMKLEDFLGTWSLGAVYR